MATRTLNKFKSVQNLAQFLSEQVSGLPLCVKVKRMRHQISKLFFFFFLACLKSSFRCISPGLYPGLSVPLPALPFPPTSDRLLQVHMVKPVQGYFVCISTSTIYFLNKGKDYIWKPNITPNRVRLLRE